MRVKGVQHTSISTMKYSISRIIFSALLILILPTFLLLSLPIFVLRLVVKVLVERFTKSKMVSVSSSIFAQLDSLHKPRCTIVSSVVLKGNILHGKFTELFNERVIKCKLSSGELRYPELQMYLENRFWFKFWKPVKVFDIKNHIKEDFQPQNFKTEEDVNLILEALVEKPFKDDASPWEIVLIKNVLPKNSSTKSKEECDTVVVLRFHHSLADGVSLIKLFLKACDIEMPKGAHSKQLIQKSVSEYLVFPFKLLLSITKAVSRIPKKDLWKLSETSKSAKSSIGACHQLRCSVFKEIANLNDTTFTAAVFASLTGAIRNICLKKGVLIPSTMSCMFPIVKPGHPDKLCNHFVYGVLDLPVGEPDPQKRLQICHENFQGLKTSLDPLVSNLFAWITGGYFNWMAKAFTPKFCGLLVSYFPILLEPESIFQFEGHQAIDNTFYVGQGVGSAGAMVCIGSFGGVMNTTVVADPTNLSEDECAEFLQMINAEAEYLKTVNMKKVE